MSNKKKEFFLVRWFKRCFLHERPELSTEEEEKNLKEYLTLRL